MVGGLEHRYKREKDSPLHYVSTMRSLLHDTIFAIVIMQSQHKGRYDAIKQVASVKKSLITGHNLASCYS